MARHGTVADTAPPLPPPPSRTIGPYELLAELGNGAVGQVFLARREGIERHFALKLLRAEVDPELAARCRRGAQLASSLDHPGIVRALDLGTFQGRLYLVAEHVPGETLANRLRTRGRLGLEEACQTILQVADALETAHEAGLVHRDLKPTNVMLDRREGCAKITDFGLAREVTGPSQLSQAGDRIGTPAYMAPEQVRGEPADARADVYALGVLLYEMLAGEPPFRGRSREELCRAILAGGPPPLAGQVSGLSPGVSQLVEEALAGDPQARPASAGAFASRLRAARSGTPPSQPGLRLGGEGGVVAGARVSRGGVGLLALLGLLFFWTASAGGLALWALNERSARVRQAVELEALRETLARSRVGEDASRREVEGLSVQLEAMREEWETLSRGRAGLSAEHEALREAQDELEDTLSALRRQALEATAGLGAPPEMLARVVDRIIELLETRDPERLRAILLHNRGRFAECIALVQQLEARGERDAELTVLAGRAAAKSGDPEAMQRAFQGAREAPPDSAPALFARFLGGEGEGDSLELLRRACRVDPEAAYVRILLAQQLERRAMALRDVDPLDEALRLAEEAIRAEPTSFQAYYQRSSARYHRWLLAGSPGDGAHERVVADLRRARELHPDPSYWLWAGKSYVEMVDRPEAACFELEEAIRRCRRPEHRGIAVMARTFLGAALMRRGDERNAEARWREAIRLAPREQAAYGFAAFLHEASPQLRERMLPLLPQPLRGEVERRLEGE